MSGKFSIQAELNLKQNFAFENIRYDFVESKLDLYIFEIKEKFDIEAWAFLTIFFDDGDMGTLMIG